jgi:hypothetical protein
MIDTTADQSQQPSSYNANRCRQLLERLLRLLLCNEPGREDEERFVRTTSEVQA